jgi:ABC-2 type transport system ATP-binding protein
MGERECELGERSARLGVTREWFDDGRGCSVCVIGLRPLRQGGAGVILTDGLTRRFDAVVAVDGLSLEIADGEIFGLLGPNGAGKTTTVRMLAGLIGVSSGHASVAGLDVTDAAQAREIRRLVGVLPEEVGLSGDLSAVRTLDFFGRLYGMGASARNDRAEELLTRLGLWERRDDPASTLSKGLKQRLALARALVHDPQVVLLDEPTANLDPEAAGVVRDVLLELKAQGRTVVVNTHRLEEAERVCDRVGILRTRLLRVGTPHELRTALTKSRIVLDLEVVRDFDLEVLRDLGVEDVTVAGSRIEAALPSAGVTSADVVAALVTGGARVSGVSVAEESLEDVYLSTLRDVT